MIDKTTKIREISIQSPSRLHLGFYGISDTYGYSYGSMGLSINHAHVNLSIKLSSSFQSNLPKKYTNPMLKYLNNINVKPKFDLKASSLPKMHIGLGSGTQITLSVIMIINKFLNLNLNYQEVVKISQRGLRSGTGIASFKDGGFIIDACKAQKKLPKILLQKKFPKTWRIILLNDKKIVGKFGKSERNFFKGMKNSKKTYPELSDIIMRGIIPSVIYEDFDNFIFAINRFQKITSKFYSSNQGNVFISNDINNIMKDMQKNNNVGIGQSSWGPLSYIFTDSIDYARDLIDFIEKKYCNCDNLTYTIVRPSNTGHIIKNKI
tara:strand:+ start:80 stop:1042 length:963 start_codon:yes stop_codon:yes gene_type:complete